jgi:tetratricopeptide (TPR) repeat protein
MQDGTVNVQNLNIGIAERLKQSGDRVRILVVAANPLGSSPLKLDHEVKTIQEALRRLRKRDNFVVEYRLAATPSELRRALLDVEPHVLHFSGHGSGEQGLLFVSDESAGTIYRSDSGEVRSRSTNSDEIKFVPAQPLANLLKLCDEHLECVVLNACYSDVQGNAISANTPFAIGMRDQVADNVAIKFSQGFYDAIGAGKGYEMAFKWGKVAIEFDLADDETSKLLVLRRKGESSQISKEYFNRGLEKQQRGDNQGAINDYNETIRLNPKNADAYLCRGNAKSALGNKEGAISDFNEVIRINPNHSIAYSNRGNEKKDLGDNQGAITDYTESIRLKNPELHLPYNNRGIAKRALEDKQGGISDHDQAIRLNPSYAEAYNNRGNDKDDLGDKEDAIADYNEAIRLNPDYALFYYSRGLIKKGRNEKKKHLQIFGKHRNSIYSKGIYNGIKTLSIELKS